MKEKFELFLIEKGYRTTTPSGNPSTVYSYLNSIEKVCEWEGINWTELADDISKIVVMYDLGGINEELGSKSHKTIINALKRYAEFVKQV
ncbi:MAG: hypothetical protein IKK51_06600 [Oscillospiraceae bacterium]|nr:hypothetical protein [Oscillospiraceae bacterium]